MNHGKKWFLFSMVVLITIGVLTAFNLGGPPMRVTLQGVLTSDRPVEVVGASCRLERQPPNLADAVPVMSARVAPRVSMFSAAVTEFDESHADEIRNSQVPVLILIYIPGESLCTEQLDIIKELVQKYAGRIKFGKINAHANPALAVLDFPTLVLRTPDGHVEKKIGLMQPSKLEAWLDDVLQQQPAHHPPAPQSAPSPVPAVTN